MASSVLEINIPYQPTTYQEPFLDAMRSGTKVALLNWHRQCGKDLSTSCGWLLEAALSRVGNYWYCFQDSKTLRRNFWDKKDDYGRPSLGYYIPYDLMYEKPHETNHQITLINPYEPDKPGSLIECVAVDSIDPETVRGATLAGVIYTEMARYKNNLVWDNLQASIRKPENDGWQVIASTPHGHNFFYDLYDRNKDNPDWFVQSLTIDDTGVYGWDFIEQQLREGADWQFLQQEYFVSFNALVRGVPFGEDYEFLVQEGRICDVPWDPGRLVHTCWDLGNDGTIVWFFQSHGFGGWKFIDLIHDSKINFEYYVNELRRKPYTYGTHLGPWDLEHEQHMIGERKVDTARELGIDFEVAPKLKHIEKEAATKRMLRQCWFDRMKCAEGLKALREYHYKWDDEKRTLSKEPVHDWSSHFVSALEVGGVMIDVVDDSMAEIYSRFEPMREPSYDYDFSVFQEQ